MAKAPERERLDEILYSTLRTIYHFERNLYSRFGLGYVEICFLQLLRRKPGLRVGEAARALELPLFTATRLGQRLETHGIISRTTDPDDKRAVRLLLSEKGRILLADIEERSYEIVKDNVAPLSEEELETFITAAGGLSQILGISDRVVEEL